MQTYRIVPRSAPRACKAACSSPPSSSSSRNMFTTPFFAPAPSHFNPVPEMAPFFRVLDTAVAELANSTAGSGADHRAARHQRRSTFTPRFDVREVGGSYELQGELPGIEQKDLEIEFVDDKTLVIKGRAEREYEESSNGLNKKEQAQDKTVAAAAAAGEENNNSDKAVAASEHSAPSYHKASVEDEDGFVDAGAEANTDKSAEAAAKGKSPESDSTATVADPDTSVPDEQSEPHFKYWVSERSVGSFERRFAFPGRVDQEAVKASLRNGILSVVVPKIVEQGARRIQIQ